MSQKAITLIVCIRAFTIQTFIGLIFFLFFSLFEFCQYLVVYGLLNFQRYRLSYKKPLKIMNRQQTLAITWNIQYFSHILVTLCRFLHFLWKVLCVEVGKEALLLIITVKIQLTPNLASFFVKKSLSLIQQIY